MTAIFLLSLLACKGDKGDTAAAADTAPYVVDTAALDLPQPTFDATSAATGVETAMAATKRVTADPLVAAYDDVIAQADSGCPTYYRNDDSTYWYDDCTADSGARFNGYGAELDYDGYSDGTYLYTGSAVYGVAEITAADGEVLSLNGGAVRLVGTSDAGVTLTQEQVSGHFSWGGSESDGTWLEEGLDPQLSRMTVSAGSAWGIGLQGSISGLSGDVDTVVFDSFLLASTAAGSPCEIEPAGTVSLRGTDGEWIDILFDVPWDDQTQTWGTMDPTTCDGCGAAWSRGVSLGQVCVDFSSLDVE